MTSDNRWTRRGVALAALAAALARLAVILGDGARFDDPDNYLPLARAIASGEGLAFKGRPTAYRPPLYPIVLAPLIALEGDHPRIGLTILHVALGAGTAALSVLAMQWLGASPRRALVAGLIVAYDPVLAWQAKSAMTETLTAFLVALATAAAAARRPGAAGATLGFASLGRPSTLPGAGLVILAAALFGPGDRRDRLRRAGAAALGVACVLLPWGVRNRLALGEFVFTTTHGGYTLALANNEVYYRQVLDGPPGTVWTGPEQQAWWDSANRRMAKMPEPEADRRLRDEVVALARREPVTFARACLSRLATFWSPLPTAGVYGTKARLATFLWTAPLWCALLVGMVRPDFRRWPGVVAPALIVGLTAVHAFYWTDLRMRAPIVPAIAVVAASASIGRRRG